MDTAPIVKETDRPSQNQPKKVCVTSTHSRGRQYTPLTPTEAIAKIKLIVPNLNENQLKSIQLVDGPLQIVAGPGSGKTLILVLRVLYIILTAKGNPGEIVLTTFTEKAAIEITERLHHYAKKCRYLGPLSEIKIGTIHSICNRIIKEFINYTPLDNKNYQILDDLTQALFIDSNFEKIVPQECKIKGFYFGKWEDKWKTIKQIIPYFNKITEELIDPNSLTKTNKFFLTALSIAYRKYIETLFQTNRIDYAFQQKLVYDLLNKPFLVKKIRDGIKYLMIDEYQDTNYVQEQILLLIAKPSNNICVVGDEDQSLYRFRGATVRNILEFRLHFENCPKIILDINYRSHPSIINAYNNLISSIDWTNPTGDINFRTEKKVTPCEQAKFQKYDSVISVGTASKEEEGKQLASLVKNLKDNNIIQDYNEVVLLLHSVKQYHSRHYIEAFNEIGIPCFAPRVKSFFENESIILLIGCYAMLFDIDVNSVKCLNDHKFSIYLELCIEKLNKTMQHDPALKQFINKTISYFKNLKNGETSNIHLVDLLYKLLAFPPFMDFLENPNITFNIAKFSQLIVMFQQYYHVDALTERNMQWVKSVFFTCFLGFLKDLGLDENVDPQNPAPTGSIQIMTIHQAKGLEFPIVIVGSLDKINAGTRSVDTDLGRFYHKSEFEPYEKINEFDTIRQYYVAFSRAAKLLILTCNTPPSYLIKPLWNNIPRANVDNSFKQGQICNTKERSSIKRSFGLTSHINSYELCPLRYRFYWEYNFSPSKPASRTFGNVVHKTIDDIHKIVIEGKLYKLTNEIIKDKLFVNNYDCLLKTGLKPLSVEQKAAALDQVFNYFNQNYDILYNILETELNISIERPGYILTGQLDLLVIKDGEYMVIDFKTDMRIKDTAKLLEYQRQLYVYAFLMKQKFGVYPHKLYIYWTSEENAEKALMEVPCKINLINDTIKYIDNRVTRIQNKEFELKKVPEPSICRDCDFSSHCVSHGHIVPDLNFV